MFKAATDLMPHEAGDHHDDRLLRGALNLALQAVAAAQAGKNTDAAPHLISEKVCSEAVMLLHLSRRYQVMTPS